MTTAYTVPKLCDTCRSVDFERFMPRASLQLPNATGEGKDGEYDVDVTPKFYNPFDPRVQTYIRNADGTPRIPSWRPHLKDLGPLTDIVSRAGTCPLCNFIAARFKKMVGENYHIHIQVSNLGFVENDPSDLSPYAFNDKRRLWDLSGIDFYCVIQSSTGLNRPRFVVPTFLASSSLVNLTRKPQRYWQDTDQNFAMYRSSNPGSNYAQKAIQVALALQTWEHTRFGSSMYGACA
jgi:hypothetical protein